MASENHQMPAVLTLTGDNALTIGLMMALLYVGALLIVQASMRVMGAKKAPKQASSVSGQGNPQATAPGWQSPSNAGQGAGY
jgi:ascorbate-specific PTS system EIIC-type component UlaA